MYSKKKVAKREARAFLGEGTLRCSLEKTGLSNTVFHVFKKNEGRVVVRFFGSDVTGKGNRLKRMTEIEENLVMEELSKKGVYPFILSVFEGGRVEQFVSGKIPTPSQIKQKHSILAKKIAFIHSLEIENAKDTVFGRHQICSLEMGIVHDLDTTAEAEWICKILGCVESELVFSHNDMNLRNLLVQDDEVTIMDFEYCGLNFRWADLASHLVEMCLAEDELFPDWNEIHNFLGEYTKSRSEIKSPVKGFDNLLVETLFGMCVIHLVRIIFAGFVLKDFFPDSSVKQKVDAFKKSKKEFMEVFSKKHTAK